MINVRRRNFHSILNKTENFHIETTSPSTSSFRFRMFWHMISSRFVPITAVDAGGCGWKSTEISEKEHICFLSKTSHDEKAKQVKKLVKFAACWCFYHLLIVHTSLHATFAGTDPQDRGKDLFKRLKRKRIKQTFIMFTREKFECESWLCFDFRVFISSALLLPPNHPIRNRLQCSTKLLFSCFLFDLAQTYVKLRDYPSAKLIHLYASSKATKEQ